MKITKTTPGPQKVVGTDVLNDMHIRVIKRRNDKEKEEEANRKKAQAAALLATGAAVIYGGQKVY